MSRVENRKGFDQATRLTLLEGDIDVLEATGSRLEAVLQRILWSLIGLLLTILSGIATALFVATQGVPQ